MSAESMTVAVVGLGYVGLPLAIEFGRHYPTIGFDLSVEKVAAYLRNVDPTGEVLPEQFSAASHFRPTTDRPLCGKPSSLSWQSRRRSTMRTRRTSRRCRRQHCGRQELSGRRDRRVRIDRLSRAHRGGLHPDHREAVGLQWKRDFFVGYSPERINPGRQGAHADHDHEGGVGRHAETLDAWRAMYGSIVKAGVYKARASRSPRREGDREHAARSQHRADQRAVADLPSHGHRHARGAQAAGTKWNFLPFRPGLVGGHCIGVDPYYLTHKAEMLGYHPQVILAGRRINDGMGKYVAEQTVKCMVNAGQRSRAPRHRAGLTFKENCPDLRNSKVIDVIRELESYGAIVHVHDPVATAPRHATSTASTLVDGNDCRGRRDRRGVAHRSWSSAVDEMSLAKLGPAGVYADVKCSADMRRRLRARGIRSGGCDTGLSRAGRELRHARAWLVTGSAGFIGSHLSRALLALGQQVTSVDNFATGHRAQPRRACDRRRRGRMVAHRFVEGDIADERRAACACEGVELVLHQAALGSVPRSIAIRCRHTAPTSPASQRCWSRRATAARSAFVYAASSSTYGDSQRLPKVEDRIGRPLSPYAVTKYVNELYADVFARCYGLPSIGLRYFNVFGPRQDPRALMPP
jgi:UDP-N-acetyl-D-galactosamine dehydrogenase